MDLELELDLELVERARMLSGRETAEEVVEEALTEWINKKLADRMNFLSNPYQKQPE